MQAEWDANQKAMLQQQQMAIEAAREQRAIEMFELDRSIKSNTLETSLEQQRLDLSLQAESQRQVDLAFKIINENRANPNVVAKSIDQMIEAGLGQALNNPDVKSALDRLSTFTQQNNSVAEERAARQEQTRLLNIESEARQAGATESQIEAAKYRINPQTGDISIDEAALMRIRDEAKRSEKKEGAREPARTRAESLRSEVVGLEAQIEEMEKEDLDPTEISKLRSQLAGKRAQLAEESGEAPIQPVEEEEVQKFDSVKDAMAANLPSGTIVEIGGRKARIK